MQALTKLWWTLGTFSPENIFGTANSTKYFDIEAELGPLLSQNASIITKSSPQFSGATLRWQDYHSPDIGVVVEVATEIDVQETIKYANQREIPFLAKSGGHGGIDSLARVHDGLEIWMRKINSIEVSSDGQTANIGGGVKSKDITDALWPLKKQTVTGFCECTGTVAPLLGGGHGILQGLHGLLADNLLSARLVLANGTAITVSSESHTPYPAFSGHSNPSIDRE
ncbi:hypothetical protein B0J14DRAFT_316655 [Halenospora varia]|nr:hypothetical protein B0J14DRAFT_316655 [Halenospora varia]